MTTYYVSPSGSNSNNGLSPATPWLTLGHANSNVASGDTILHLAGGTWNDQYYYFAAPVSLGVYNGSVRWVMDYDGSDGGSLFGMVTFEAPDCSIDSAELRNNMSGSDVPSGGRGIVYNDNNVEITNCYIHEMGTVGIIHNFGGENTLIDGCILEHTDAYNTNYAPGGYPGGGWGAAISGVDNDDDPLNGYTVRNCQLFECGGEGITMAAGINTSTPTIVEDNDLCGIWSVGIYVAGGEDFVRRRNMVLGTTNSDYHRFGAYTGPAFSIASEVSGYELEDIHDYLNLLAGCDVGMFVISGGATALRDHYCGHNTLIDNDENLFFDASTVYDGTNVFEQNASFALSAGTVHDDGTNVPGGSSYTNRENLWYGGGEHANWNDASDFSDSAWLPFKSAGWQAIDALGDVTIEDWRPTALAQATQRTNPDTSANFADYEGTADFREAGAVAYASEAPPPDPDPEDPPTPQTPLPLGRLFATPRVTPLSNGAPVPGGRLYFYQSGGNTEVDVYTDAALSRRHTNPVRANAAGEFPPIYLNPASEPYRVKLTTSVEMQVWVEDDIYTDINEAAKIVVGNFTGSIEGCSAAISPLISYRIVQDQNGTGKVVTLKCVSGGTGTSNTTSLALNAVPAFLQPSSSVSVPCVLTENSASVVGAARVGDTVSRIEFLCDAPLDYFGFTNSGTKGLPTGWTITYPL